MSAYASLAPINSSLAATAWGLVVWCFVFIRLVGKNVPISAWFQAVREFWLWSGSWVGGGFRRLLRFAPNDGRLAMTGMGYVRSRRENGAPDRIRTCDPRLRRAVLYPAELRALRGWQCTFTSHPRPRSSGFPTLVHRGGSCPHRVHI